MLTKKKHIEKQNKCKFIFLDNVTRKNENFFHKVEVKIS